MNEEEFQNVELVDGEWEQDLSEAEARVARLKDALREITATDWDSSEGITPFQFEQRIHKIAADALMALAQEEAQ